MPQVSDRADAMPASPIRRLAPYADQAAANGIKILHLNIGQPDFASPPRFWEAIRTKPLTVLEYSHSAGHASLRARLRAHYALIGIPLQEHELIVTTAGSEALQFAMQACLNPGEEVIVPEPLYANYLGFACQGGVHVVPIRTRIEDDFALPGPEAFQARITPRTKAILINNPGNPTGAVYGRAQLEALRDIALRHDLFVLADEVYRDFNYTSEPIVSVMQLEGLEKHAVMVDSASKRFSLCGARVGFLISRNADVMSAGLRFAQARLSPPTLEQFGIEAALDTPEAYFVGMREEFRARRDLLSAGLNAMTGVLCPRIDGAFYATVRLPVDDSDRFSQWLLEEFHVDRTTVMLAPATGFYATQGLGTNEVRIAYVQSRDVLAQALGILRTALATYHGRTCEQRATASA